MKMGLRRMRIKLLAITFCSLAGLLAIVQYYQYRAIPELEDESDGSSWWLTWTLRDHSCEQSRKRAKTRLSSKSWLETADLYQKLNFEVQAGNKYFWNRTFEERYLQTRMTWSKLPLEVIVVPHAHVDTTWLKTYDEYYNFYVARILDNMVKFLNKTSDFTFIWSEISFFSRWFDRLDSDVKNTVIDLINKRQLEITTGGWVMPDEATTHYWSIIDQLVEGHQWLKSAIGTIPSYAWSIDVFGHSSFMQLLLAAVGMKGSIVLRTHYAMKAYLAKYKSLDFYWMQNMDDSRILCHMIPSDLYSIKHSCGPDPRVCLQFDFRRIQNEYTESVATDINTENVKPKAERLLSQYGRFASLYPHNVILIPLGDDFRYDEYVEWEQQYNNYNRLFKYINANAKNVHVRFGTVADYFEQVTRRLENHSLPSIHGDFFPYADIYVDSTPSYWTGLYNTRPFDKALARELQHWLRSAEILYSLARPATRNKSRRRLNSDYAYLMGARHTLDLFQHHDAITGTSKQYVTEEFRKRLHAGIEEAMGIVTHAAQQIVMAEHSLKSPFTSRMHLDLTRAHPGALTSRIATSVPPEGRKILLFNSLSYSRKEIIRVKVKSPYLAVLNKDGVKVTSQINPVWDSTARMISNVYELIFVCEIEALSFVTYTIITVPKEIWDTSSKAEVSLHVGDQEGSLHKHSSFFSLKQQIPPDIQVESPSITTKFSKNGLLKELYIHRDHLWQKVNVNFLAYISTPQRSGAYLFHPSSSEGPIPLSNMTDVVPMVRIVRGTLLSEVTFIHPFISFTTKIYGYDDAPRYLDMEAVFDISRARPDLEFVMRIGTGINNGGTFYTDSNGIEMLRRKNVKKLPLQGNVYPVVTSTFIEDKVSRLNVLTSQSSGVAVPNSGTLEIMLDRRLQHDDYRGMAEGVLDNRPTAAHFRMLLEHKPEDSRHDYPLLTPVAHRSSLSKQYPIITFVVDQGNHPPQSKSFTSNDWPLGTHLVNLRTLPSSKDYYKPSNYSLLTVLKQNLACDYTSASSSLELDVSALLLNMTSHTRTSLTGIHDEIQSSNFRTFESYNISFTGG